MKPDDDFERLFQGLEPVTPRAEFMQGLREIPLAERRSERSWLPLPFRDFRFALALAASLLLGLWFGSTELGDRASNEDVLAFISLDSGSVQAEPFDVSLLE
jgi:hypothetical protein